jgi:hypothetical protein
MTRADFDHLLNTIKSLPPEQMRQLRQQLDRMQEPPARPTQPPAPPPRKGAKRAKPAKGPKEPPSIEELHRKMMARGLILRLPDPSLDIDDDDPEDQPIVIEGEPLSETILRERR